LGFSSLQHIRSRRSTCRGLCLPATFRLQGLVTLVTASSLRFRAGFVSHRRRSWDSPFGAFSFRKVSRPFPNGRTHILFSLSVYPHRSTGRLDRPQFLGFAPSESPWRPSMLLTRRPLDAPLGLAPLRLRRMPWLGFRPASSHALFRPGLFTRTAAPRSLDQHPLRSNLPCGKPQVLAEPPFWGFRTGLHPEHSNAHPSGLFGSPRAASHITADRPTFFGWFGVLPELLRIG